MVEALRRVQAPAPEAGRMAIWRHSGMAGPLRRSQAHKEGVGLLSSSSLKKGVVSQREPAARLSESSVSCKEKGREGDM